MEKNEIIEEFHQIKYIKCTPLKDHRYECSLDTDYAENPKHKVIVDDVRVMETLSWSLLSGLSIKHKGPVMKVDKVPMDNPAIRQLEIGHTSGSPEPEISATFAEPLHCVVYDINGLHLSCNVSERADEGLLRL